MKNEHITEYLDYYIELEYSPEFAVLLRGEWGVGKSWFVKNYIKRRNLSDHILYVSLNGVTSYKQIEDSFYQQLHPNLSSKPARFLGKILKSALKGSLKIDLDGDGKEDGSVSPTLPDIDLAEELKKLENKRLIFDDLERCAIPINDILGYINEYVEQYGLKVIIISNEAEILVNQANETNTLKQYQTIKEKVIGKSFDVQLDLKTALDEFINNLETDVSKEILLEYKPAIEKCFTEAKYNNLRHLKQTLQDYQRFHRLLPVEIKDKKDLIEHIIKLFFTISFEIKKGSITESQIPSILFPSVRKDQNQFFSKIHSKYSILREYNHPINNALLIDYFKNGTVEIVALKESVLSSAYFANQNTPALNRLIQYYDLENDEFDSFTKEVLQALTDKTVSEKYELLSIVGMLLFFSKNKLIPNHINDILKLAQENTKNLLAKGLLALEYNENFPSNRKFHGESLGFDLDEFQLYLEYMKHATNEGTIQLQAKAGKTILDLLVENPTSFFEMITLTNSGKNIYYNRAIFAYIDKTKFVDTIFSIPNKIKKELSWAINDRYKSETLQPALFEEIDWWESVLKMTKAKSAALEMNIDRYILETKIIPSISEAISTIKRHKKSVPN